MKVNLSPLHRFGDIVTAFIYPARDDGPNPYALHLEALRMELADIHPELDGLCLARIEKHLQSTIETVGKKLVPYQKQQLESLAWRNLEAAHSFEILFDRARFADSLHRFAFDQAISEFPLLAHRRCFLLEKELRQKRTILPRKLAQLNGLRGELDLPGGEEPEDADSRAYYEKVAAELSGEIAGHEEELLQLEQAHSSLHAPPMERAQIEKKMVMFARGGYGRAELSFSSDIDTGYCLDTRGLNQGQIMACHDLVMRMEELLRAAGMETAHQFFEIEENLERFTSEDSLHTIPSILESRSLAGRETLLLELKERFKEILPFEILVRKKIEEYERQSVPGLTDMNLKEDFGGLRSIQIPLWLLGITHKASSFMTMDLLQLARQLKLLSVWEVSRFLLALEFLNELRNFSGAAEAFYYDREARESGFHVPGFKPNRIDDPLTRLYLFRKRRFASVDEFDALRLSLVEEVQKISRLLMARVLDRTITHKMEGLHASVHLGQKRIINISSRKNGGSANLSALFQDGGLLLTLFSYIAQTDYDLSIELKDALAGVVMGFAGPTDPEGLSVQAGQWSVLMGAPYAHRALATLSEINDPLSEGMPSLLGRFIPAMDQARFLVRRFDSHPIPLQQHMLRSMVRGQEALDELKRDHPELYGLVGREDILALKWALLLCGIGRIPSGGQPASQMAEQAADVLSSLGYRDPEMERRVRLLIEHHDSLIALSRTATYMDQALAQFFEIAERNLVHVILLYLINSALLQARGEDFEGDLVRLRRLFLETDQILGEMQGFPVRERSLEMINVYFDRKKTELVSDTRLHLLLQQSIAKGLQETLLDPLSKAGSKDWDRLHPHLENLRALQKKMLLGDLNNEDRNRATEKMLRMLRQSLSEDSIRLLLAAEGSLVSWFFSSYPNRFLIGSTPASLAAELAKFTDFRKAKAIVDIVPGHQGGNEGLLIFTQGLNLSHTRVAYALSRFRFNIGSGKVNRVEIGQGRQGYCYYFEIARLDPDRPLQARELEKMIGSETPPEMDFPERPAALRSKGIRVEFRGDDGKGYRVVPEKEEFVRVPAAFQHIRLVLRDEPFLFYKVSRAFDLFEVEIQQSLITTTGNQVMDYFYLLPEDYQRLRNSNFEEVFVHLVHSDLMSVVK